MESLLGVHRRNFRMSDFDGSDPRPRSQEGEGTAGQCFFLRQLGPVFRQNREGPATATSFMAALAAISQQFPLA